MMTLAIHALCHMKHLHYYLRLLFPIIISGASLALVSGCADPSEIEKRNISEQQYQAFQEKDAMVFSKGKEDPKRTLFVFERIDCIHCIKFREEFRKLSDIKVQSYLVVTEKNWKNTLDYWCRYRESQKLSCDVDALKRNNSLAQQLSVTGTPAIIFPNRVMYNGYMSAGQVENVLKEIK